MGKKLAVHNRKKREAKKREEQAQLKSRVNQYYGIGAVMAVGVIGGAGCYIYRTKKGEVKDASITRNPTVSQQPSNKFEMD